MIDYSLYLVTGRTLLPKGKDYYESLEEAIQGGVTLVQIREKNIETSEFLEIARRSQEICKRHHVPIIINDRIDIALAIGADGVHLGQDDMPIEVARRLLPKGTIIGISCNNLEHVQVAVEQGADYIGIGAIYHTNTKKLTTSIVTVRGVGHLLQALDGTNVKAVAIGGINSKNALRVLHGTVSPTNHALDGLAVVSDIMAVPHPKDAAERLANIIRAFRDGPSVLRGLSSQSSISDPSSLLSAAGLLLTQVRSQKPLVHQITNTVVANQSANITLALGASPIMADSVEEMEDLSKITDALLINIGTLRAGPKAAMLEAGVWNNVARKPIVLDPVGIGASEFRSRSAQELLNLWAPSVIKGNAGELAAFAGSKEVESKGVDSVGDGFKDPVNFVRKLALKERCIIVLSGPVDYVSDGTTVVACKNGHKLLGDITGSGCILGSCVATFCAAASALVSPDKRSFGTLVDGDLLIAAVVGVLALTIASEHAVAKPEVQGPGTLLSHLIDSLSQLTPEHIVNEANIEIL